MGQPFAVGDVWMEVTPGRCRRNSRSLRQHGAELVRNLWQAAYLVRSNLRRRSFGMVLGDFWLVMEPFLYAGLYYFLIQIILQVHDTHSRFLFIFTSVTFWRLHAHMFGAAPNLILNRASALRQTVFPLQMVVYEFVGTELGFFVFKLGVLFAFLILNGVYPTAAWAYLPLVLAVQIAFSTALLLFLAAAGTFVRDLGRSLFVVVSVWWYLSPGMYGVHRIPEAYRSLYGLNPFAHLLPAYHDILLLGHAPLWEPLAGLMGISILGIVFGWALLNRVRHYFFLFL